MQTWQAVAVGIIPSIGVGAIFWFAMRAVIRADRNERQALAREEQANEDFPVDISGDTDSGAADVPGGDTASRTTATD